jgi:hypothetical protein
MSRDPYARDVRGVRTSRTSCVLPTPSTPLPARPATTTPPRGTWRDDVRDVRDDVRRRPPTTKGEKS